MCCDWLCYGALLLLLSIVISSSSPTGRRHTHTHRGREGETGRFHGDIQADSGAAGPEAQPDSSEGQALKTHQHTDGSARERRKLPTALLDWQLIALLLFILVDHFGERETAKSLFFFQTRVIIYSELRLGGRTLRQIFLTGWTLTQHFPCWERAFGNWS